MLVGSDAVANVKLLHGKRAITLRHNNEKNPDCKSLNQWQQYRAGIIFNKRLHLMLAKTT